MPESAVRGSLNAAGRRTCIPVFYKAFDTVERDLILRYGFGKYFCSRYQLCLRHGTPPRFNLNRDIRQDCPNSAYLLLLVSQVLCEHIKNSNIKTISVAETEDVISQVADHTTLKNALQLPVVINVIEPFSTASGLHQNTNECELLAIKYYTLYY